MGGPRLRLGRTTSCLRAPIFGGATRGNPRELQWDFFLYLPIVLQDATTRDALMVQYMTEERLANSPDQRSMWLWSRSREDLWMACRSGGGDDLLDLRANRMGDSLLAVVDTTDRGVCHFGYRKCFSQPVEVTSADG